MLFRSFRQLWPLFAGILAALPAMAANEAVQVELVSEAAEVRPGDSFRAGVKIAVAEGWHIYGEEPGLTGLPTTVEWNLPEGATAGPVRYPPTVPFVFLGEEGEGYKGTIVLWSLIETSPNLEAPLTLEANVSWLVCREICVPGSVDVSLTVPVAATTLLAEEAREFFGEPEEPATVAASADRVGPGGSLAYFLLAGFIGGLILNIMPCVLPVIGLKIMSVVRQSGNDPRQIRMKGWAFTAGVVMSFWILALLVVLLQGAGRSVGHGFQFQNFPFVIAITTLIFVLALSMLGVFMVDIGSSGHRGAQRLTDKGGLSGPFFNGALATVLATPCTAPLLGVALGFAFTQPAWVTFTVFTFIGFGLAFPFTLLAYRPDWLRFLPKPGIWMERFKQSMGFLMLAVVLWLLWVIRYRGPDAVVWMVVFLFAVGLACWIFGAFHSAASSQKSRWAARALIALIVAGAWQGILEGRLQWRGEAPAVAALASTSGEDRINWRAFSEESLAEALESDVPVFVNFTAAWCVSCLANERTSLEVQRTRRAILDTNTIAIKADWTNPNDEITQKLRSFNRAGIPFYLVYGKDRNNPVILPELLTPQMVINALERAKKSFDE